MELINIDFKGWIQVDKDDLVMDHNQPGTYGKVKVEQMTAEEIIDGYRKGKYDLDFEATYKKTLDGEELYELSIEEE